MSKAQFAAAMGFTAAAGTDFPLSERDAAWDAAAASKRWQDECGIGGDSPDWAKFHTGFFWFDPDKAETVGAHKLGFVDVEDGTPTAIWKGITASAGAIQGARGGVDIPEGDVSAVKTAIAKWYDEAAKEYDDTGIKPPWEADDQKGQASLFLLAYAETGSTDALDLFFADDESTLIGVGGGGPEMTEFLERRAYWDVSAEQVALDGMRERLQHTAKCECGHSYSEHLGTSGPCTYEDGRGTCSCGGFAEMSTGESGQAEADGMVAAAGDLVWGPEDGFQDLLWDVNEALQAMDVYGYCAVDATVDLTRVLICDWDRDECFVIPITIDENREPVLGEVETWLHVESGWVETNPSYAARLDAARSVPQVEGTTSPVMKLKLNLTSLRAAAGDVELIPEHEPQDVRPDENTSPELALSATRGPLEWDAIFVPEGRLTDDGRAIAPGALTWRELPLSLGAMLDTPHADAVTSSPVCGRIDSIWREDGTGLIRASGVFDDGDYGMEIARMVTDGTLRGVSVDLAIYKYETGPRSDFFDAEGNWDPKADRNAGDQPALVDLLFGDPDEPTIYVIHEAVIGATTVCPFPAFADAKIESAASLVAGSSPAIVTVTSPSAFRVVERHESATVVAWRERVEEYAAMTEPERVAEYDRLVADGLSDSEARGTVWHDDVLAVIGLPEEDALTASADGLAPELPPRDWFGDPGLEEPTALVVTDDGRIFGHAATWDTCHIAFGDTCVTPPHSEADYAYYLLGEVACDDGSRVPCGQITLGTGHASLSLGRAAATAHYDDTGLAIADVTVGEDDHGIWVAGAVRPAVDADRVRELMAAKLSGDWRRIDGGPLELVALLAVNVPGFPIPRAPSAVVASGDHGEEVLALVAAGIPGGITDDDRERLLALAASASQEA